MSKMMRCRDAGLDCDYVAQADTEAEIMRQVAVHVRAVHGMKHLAPELAIRVRGAIQDEVLAPPASA